MSEWIPLPPSNLLIDAENPRLTQPSTGQRDALRELAQNQQRKLVALAKDIVEHGLNPADLPIVMPAQDDLKRYLVLEGNRRLAALKGLENPDALVGALAPTDLEKLRVLSRKYQTSPIESVQCLVVKDREEAEHWITLRHTGENEGVGIVRWGGGETMRFRARTGSKEIHSQALDFLEEHGQLTLNQRKKVPVTSLKRLLGTPEVREKLGLDLKDGHLLVVGDPAKVAKALNFVTDSLADGTTKVKDIYTQQQRTAFAENLPKNIVVKTKVKMGRSMAGAGAAAPATPKPNRSGHKPLKLRDKLIPRDCVISVSDPRIRRIEGELRSLSLDQHTNAVSVLCRVFFELSADAYLDSHKGLPATETDSLAKKFTVIVDDLVARQKLTKQQAAPVRTAAQKNSFLAPSVHLMHGYIHNRHVFPAPGDLRAYWDSLHPFAIAMWAP